VIGLNLDRKEEREKVFLVVCSLDKENSIGLAALDCSETTKRK